MFGLVGAAENPNNGRFDMKRHGNLWNQVIDMDNLRYAYVLARKGKGRKEGVRKFARNLEKNLAIIRDMLVTKTFRTSMYSMRTIYEPKKREIFILPFYPDRIVQHAVMNVLEPIWDNMFIAESYACRVGKGMHKGSIKTMQFIRKNRYCLKCDIRKFYPSINHAILKQIIRRKIKDQNVLWLLDDIIDSYPGETNTPIGNYTSQWFGNVYMNELDKFVKQDLRIKAYLRYCDDFLFFANSKEELHDIAAKVKAFCAERLHLTLSKCDVFPVSRGVDFLGYRHFPKYILLRKSTAKRAKRRIKSIMKRAYAHKITLGQFRSTIASYIGWMRWAKTYNLRRALDVDRIMEVCKNVRNIDELCSRL